MQRKIQFSNLHCQEEKLLPCGIQYRSVCVTARRGPGRCALEGCECSTQALHSPRVCLRAPVLFCLCRARESLLCSNGIEISNMLLLHLERS